MPETLRLGARGIVVQDLQGDLRACGLRIKPDAIFGPRTDEAVRRLQRASGLKDDGIVGPRTWRALERQEAASTATDAFDPEGYARWLAEQAGQVGARVADFFSAKAQRPATARAQPPGAATGQRPAPRPTPATAGTAPTPVLSPSQNRHHRRIAFPGYKGQGYVATDFRKYTGWEVQLVGKHIVRPFQGGLSNECAQFVQLFGVPRVREWRAGPRVCNMRPGQLPIGTVVATLRDGTYHSDYSGRSHVGIYLGHDPYDPALGNRNPGGIRLLDQYNRVAIAERTKPYSTVADKTSRPSKKPWVDSTGQKRTHRVSWISDGEEYFVVLTN